MTPQYICDTPSAEGSPRALTNNSGDATCSTHGQPCAERRQPSFSKEAMPVLGGLCPGREYSSTEGAISSVRKPVSSDTRRPAHTARCNMARSRTPVRVDGSGASSKACISSWARYGTRRESVFLKGIARTRRTCSSAAGSRCSKNRKKERIAARRMFRVSAEFPTSGLQMFQECADQLASNCSSIRADGATLNSLAANSNSNWKL